MNKFTSYDNDIEKDPKKKFGSYENDTEKDNKKEFESYSSINTKPRNKEFVSRPNKTRSQNGKGKFTSYNGNTEKETTSEFRSYDRDSYREHDMKFNSYDNDSVHDTDKKFSNLSYDSQNIKNSNKTFESYGPASFHGEKKKFSSSIYNTSKQINKTYKSTTSEINSNARSKSYTGFDTGTSSYRESKKFMSYDTQKHKSNSSTYNSLYDREELAALLNSNCIYDKDEIEWYDKFNRFGCIDPYNRLGITKEYLFFVKPDLHIWEPNTTTLNPQLAKYPYFIELSNRYPNIVQSLQRSAGTSSPMKKNPFIAILSNAVKNTLDLEDLTSDDIESATNMYGTKIMYRKHTWSGDENIEFSLEFEDTRYLEIFNLVKAYDKYNRLSQFGVVDPPNIDGAKISSSGFNYNSYCKNKELHETFGVYKIITDEDYTTILYAAYLCGVYFKNVPRSALSDITQGDPLKYTLQFHAFSVDDDPEVLADFNNLIVESYGSLTSGREFPIYNDSKGIVDGGWATHPYIAKVYKGEVDPNAWDGIGGMQYKYQLRWRL